MDAIWNSILETVFVSFVWVNSCREGNNVQSLGPATQTIADPRYTLPAAVVGCFCIVFADCIVLLFIGSAIYLLLDRKSTRLNSSHT